MTTKYASKFGPNLANTLDAIENRTPFNAGNLRGEFNYQGAYVVLSYAAVIAVYIEDGNGWDVTTRKYSATTSAHTAVVRRALSKGVYRLLDF